LEVAIPPLHFSKKKRGRLESKAEIFMSTGVTNEQMMQDLDQFVPETY
jgi:hypothetical protein